VTPRGTNALPLIVHQFLGRMRSAIVAFTASHWCSQRLLFLYLGRVMGCNLSFELLLRGAWRHPRGWTRGAFNLGRAQMSGRSDFEDSRRQIGFQLSKDGPVGRRFCQSVWLVNVVIRRDDRNLFVV
jgi:hypothetical protein